MTQPNTPKECHCHCTECQHEPFAGKPCSICKHTHTPPPMSEQTYQKFAKDFEKVWLEMVKNVDENKSPLSLFNQSAIFNAVVKHFVPISFLTTEKQAWQDEARKQIEACKIVDEPRYNGTFDATIDSHINKEIDGMLSLPFLTQRFTPPHTNEGERK